MLVLVLVLVLKDSLRTKMQSLSWSLSLTMQSLSLSLSLSLLLKSLSLSLNKSPWSCPCDCVQMEILHVDLIAKYFTTDKHFTYYLLSSEGWHFQRAKINPWGRCPIIDLVLVLVLGLEGQVLVNITVLITSAKASQAMFSLCLFVCWLVCLLTMLLKKLWTDFYESWWVGGHGPDSDVQNTPKKYFENTK